MIQICQYKSDFDLFKLCSRYPCSAVICVSEYLYINNCRDLFSPLFTCCNFCTVCADTLEWFYALSIFSLTLIFKCLSQENSSLALLFQSTCRAPAQVASVNRCADDRSKNCCAAYREVHTTPLLFCRYHRQMGIWG